MAPNFCVALCLASSAGALRVSPREARAYLAPSSGSLTSSNSRRAFGKLVFSGLAAPSVTTAVASPARAVTNLESSGVAEAARDALLLAIAANRGDASVMAAIAALQPFDPSQVN